MNKSEIENRIASVFNRQPHMSGRQINRLHGSTRRAVEDLAQDIAAHFEQSNDRLIDATAALAAAISLLERTPKAKLAAPSDKMFKQMLADYRASLDRARSHLKGTPSRDAW